MSDGQGKPQNGQGNFREKSGNFVRAHGWTPCHIYHCYFIWIWGVAPFLIIKNMGISSVMYYTSGNHYGIILSEACFFLIDGLFALSWWRHQMETFPASLALCAGNSPVPVNSPHKGQWRGALMFSLICARINGWVNNREAGDLRRHRAHYDVVVMDMIL